MKLSSAPGASCAVGSRCRPVPGIVSAGRNDSARRAFDSRLSAPWSCAPTGRGALQGERSDETFTGRGGRCTADDVRDLSVTSGPARRTDSLTLLTCFMTVSTLSPEAASSCRVGGQRQEPPVATWVSDDPFVDRAVLHQVSHRSQTGSAGVGENACPKINPDRPTASASSERATWSCSRPVRCSI
jgi:hypothetical protein